MKNIKAYIICIITALMLPVMGGCTKTVELAGQKLPEDTQEIKAVLTASELAALDNFPQLKSVDLSGSNCYAEIEAWKAAHGDINVLYEIIFPDGTAVPRDVTEVSMATAKSGDAQSIISLIPYLPQLQRLCLTGSELSVSEVCAIAEAYPDIEIEFSFPLFGQTTDLYVKYLDLRGIPFEQLYPALPDIAALPHLRRLELGSVEDGNFTWEQIGQIEALCPNVRYDYEFGIYGKIFNISDRTLDINHIQVGDNGAQAVAVMPYMMRLETLDMDSCGVSNEVMQSIRDMFPKVNVVWRVWFGTDYSVRTDVKKILASKPSAGGNLTPANTEGLYYCNKVKYLDIGHNEILRDISFVSGMPELEVAVLAMDNISDLSPLAACTKLEYLEVQSNPFTDLTPLSGLVGLHHLNIARNGGVTDLSPLKGLVNLERLWIGSGNYPTEQADELRELLPKCEINTTVFSDPTDAGWRITGVNPDPNMFFDVYLHPRYEKLVEQFGYTDKDFSLSWNDPKY